MRQATTRGWPDTLGGIVAILRIEAKARAVKQLAWVLLGGVCSLAVGFGIFFWPRATLHVVAVLFAVQLIAAALYRYILAASSWDRPGRVIPMAALASLALVLGLFLLENPAISLAVLALVVSIYWLVQGVIELIEAQTYRHWTDRGWVVASGVMAIVVGLIVVGYVIPTMPLHLPQRTFVLLTRVLGSWLIIYGAIVLIRAVHSPARRVTAVDGG
jgi:uncharacterized membrane protein HdeD (DUF308 family)